MKEGAVVFVVIGLALGLRMGARWVRMQNARKGWVSARAGVPKAKAARKAAWGAYFLSSRAAFLMGLVILVIFFVMFRVGQAG